MDASKAIARIVRCGDGGSRVYYIKYFLSPEQKKINFWFQWFPATSEIDILNIIFLNLPVVTDPFSTRKSNGIYPLLCAKKNKPKSSWCLNS